MKRFIHDLTREQCHKEYMTAWGMGLTAIIGTGLFAIFGVLRPETPIPYLAAALLMGVVAVIAEIDSATWALKADILELKRPSR